MKNRRPARLVGLIVFIVLAIYGTKIIITQDATLGPTVIWPRTTGWSSNRPPVFFSGRGAIALGCALVSLGSIFFHVAVWGDNEDDWPAVARITSLVSGAACIASLMYVVYHYLRVGG